MTTGGENQGGGCTMFLVGPLGSANEQPQSIVRKLWHPTIAVGR